jgi:hypothetical protein
MQMLAKNKNKSTNSNKNTGTAPIIVSALTDSAREIVVADEHAWSQLRDRTGGTIDATCIIVPPPGVSKRAAVAQVATVYSRCGFQVFIRDGSVKDAPPSAAVIKRVALHRRKDRGA